jgi:acylphosphatase
VDRIRANVQGRVQGVSFRYYTQRQSNSLGLTGWVRNEPDGSVEVLAEGNKETLSRLIDFLQTGPRSANVRNIEVSWSTGEQQFNSFEIRWR